MGVFWWILLLSEANENLAYRICTIFFKILVILLVVFVSVYKMSTYFLPSFTLLFNFGECKVFCNYPYFQPVALISWPFRKACSTLLPTSMLGDRSHSKKNKSINLNQPGIKTIANCRVATPWFLVFSIKHLRHYWKLYCTLCT